MPIKESFTENVYDCNIHIKPDGRGGYKNSSDSLERILQFAASGN